MRRWWMLSGLVGLAMVVGAAVAGDDEKMTLDQVPAAAREALLKLAGGAQITEVEREKEHGMTCYEAEWTANDRKTEAKVTADGDLVEMEEKVEAGEVPSAVRAVAAREFPAGAQVTYEKKTMVVYEIEAKLDGKEKELLVLPTGKVFGKKRGHEDDGEQEQKLSLEQVPAAVQATIVAEAKGATIKEVERETKHGQTVYEAEWVENGQEVEIKVGADGKLLKRQIEDQDDEDDDDDDDDDK